jgi:hypothetical protein
MKQSSLQESEYIYFKKVLHYWLFVFSSFLIMQPNSQMLD